MKKIKQFNKTIKYIVIFLGCQNYCQQTLYTYLLEKGFGMISVTLDCNSKCTSYEWGMYSSLLDIAKTYMAFMSSALCNSTLNDYEMCNPHNPTAPLMSNITVTSSSPEQPLNSVKLLINRQYSINYLVTINWLPFLKMLCTHARNVQLGSYEKRSPAVKPH